MTLLEGENSDSTFWMERVWSPLCCHGNVTVEISWNFVVSATTVQSFSSIQKKSSEIFHFLVIWHHFVSTMWRHKSSVTIPALRAPVSKARSRACCDCFCWMRARLACLLSLLTHNVDRYLIYQKLYLFWEFTRVKIGVSNIKVTVGCDGRRLILKTFNLLWWRPPQCVPWSSW